jgi:hypothetical protein
MCRHQRTRQTGTVGAFLYARNMEHSSKLEREMELARTVKVQEQANAKLEERLNEPGKHLLVLSFTGFDPNRPWAGCARCDATLPSACHAIALPPKADLQPAR